MKAPHSSFTTTSVAALLGQTDHLGSDYTYCSHCVSRACDSSAHTSVTRADRRFSITNAGEAFIIGIDYQYGARNGTSVHKAKGVVTLDSTLKFGTSTYQLTCVVFHRGADKAGHFVAAAFLPHEGAPGVTPSCAWQLFDDANPVTVVRCRSGQLSTGAVNGDPILLCYQRLSSLQENISDRVPASHQLPFCLRALPSTLKVVLLSFLTSDNIIDVLYQY